MPEPHPALIYALVYEALMRWNVDQEIGSSSDLAEWVDEYLHEKLGDDA